MDVNDRLDLGDSVDCKTPRPVEEEEVYISSCKVLQWKVGSSRVLYTGIPIR